MSTYPVHLRHALLQDKPALCEGKLLHHELVSLTLFLELALDVGLLPLLKVTGVSLPVAC